MENEMFTMLKFMGEAFLHIWPYIVVTIPLAVAVNMSGASRYIKRAFEAGPVTAILLATVVGAFSPFCSCGVIPVIAAMLISGVPLAPVMSFWIASPSMDPEIFFLSVATIGWDLAMWRLTGTLFLSIGAGFITHVAVQNDWLGADILRSTKFRSNRKSFSAVENGWGEVKRSVLKYVYPARSELTTAPAVSRCCAERQQSNEAGQIVQIKRPPIYRATQPTNSKEDQKRKRLGRCEKKGFRARLVKESLAATLMVIKFMALAFLLEALIVLYVPPELITRVMGGNNSWAILTAALLGIPTYTSNLTALPMMSGLLNQGMSPAAALAFLVAGPTTTLPAMAAVWTLVSARVFAMYLSFVLIGAIGLGYLKHFLG
jgi:uncharacterized membrane protein YraQ (UPF0718 family)